MQSSTSDTLMTSRASPDPFLDSLTSDRDDLASFRLEEAPVYQDELIQQNPLLHLLYHRDTITHLVWCSAGRCYITGGADGAVKLWRSEVKSRATSSHRTPSTTKRSVLIPEIHVISLGAPVTDLRTSGKDIGNSEVAVAASADGTLTLFRTSTGEVIRTLRGVRGESLDVVGAPAATQSDSARAGSGSASPVKVPPSSFAAEGDKQISNRSRALTWYSADAHSTRFPADANDVVVRRPVFMVRAYESEAREVLAGPSSEYFKGLRTIAPTYEHLTPHVVKSSDILAQFSLSPAPTGPVVMHRQWYASAVAFAAAPSVIQVSKTNGNGGSSSHSALDPVLLLGFPQGLVQVYVLPQRWFALHQHGETRLDPPAMRTPVFSRLLHRAGVLRVDAIRSRDLVVSVSEDGTTQLRRLSCLYAPLRQLGVAVSLSKEVSGAVPSYTGGTSSSTPTRRQRIGIIEGHSRFVTCCCIDDEQQLLITGSTDHTLCWWSLTTSSSSTPIRSVSLRDLAGRDGVDNEASSTAGTQASVVRGGYPIDVSFFRRRRSTESERSTSPASLDRDEAVSSSSLPPSSSVPLCLLVLDTELGLRIFDALSGKLITYAFDSRSSRLAPGGETPGVANRMLREAAVARYDCVNGSDRVLLGGRCLVSWYISNSAESGVTRGHVSSIIFTTWCASLQCTITADSHHVLLWQLQTEEEDEPKAKVLRAWFIPTGIRAITLCDTWATDDPSHPQRPSLIIAHASEPVVNEYDCLLKDSSMHSSRSQLPQPRVLRRLNIQPGAFVDVLATVGVAPNSNTAASKVVAVEVPTAFSFVACQFIRKTVDDASHDVSEDGCMFVYPLRWSSNIPNPGSNSASMAIRGSAEMIAPQRTLHLYKLNKGGSNIIASVLGLPCVNRLVLGGQRTLYITPLFSMTTSAAPCHPLPTSVRTLQPVALFPGPLMPLDDSAASDTLRGDTAGQGIGGTGVSPVLTDSSITGFLSRLVHISHDTVSSALDTADAHACLVLSGSNDGLLQLWDVQNDRELWQCCAVPTHESITALAVHQTVTQCLVAVGDQSGVVTLLDITKVVECARSVMAASARASRRSLTNVPGWSRWGLEGGEGQMLERWVAHGDAVSGAMFTTIPAGAGDEGATSLQLLTTGEDSAVMLWTLPSWTLQPDSPVPPNDELSGIPLFRPYERPSRKKGRLPVNPMRLQTNRMRLPWGARQIYEPWRYQYVRLRLLGGKPTELSTALTRFYRHKKFFGDFAAGESEDMEIIQGESEEETKLIDRAWAVLSADAEALSRSFAHLSSVQGDAPAVGPRRRTVVQAWCTSLSQGADPEFTDSVNVPNVSMTTHQPHLDEKGDNPFCESRTQLSEETGGVRKLTPLLSPLIFAFADRCCDNRGGNKRGSTRHQRSSTVSTSSSSVRECLRHAICMGVKSFTRRSSPQHESRGSIHSQLVSNTTLGAKQLPLISDPSDPADKSPLQSERPKSASDAVPESGDKEASADSSRAPPGSAVASIPPDEAPDIARSSSPTPQEVTDRVVTPQRHVGFTVDADECVSAQSLAPAQVFQNPSVRKTVKYHVSYKLQTPLVWSSPVGRPGSSSKERGRLLRATYNTSVDTTIESPTSQPPASVFSGGHEAGNNQPLSTANDAQQGNTDGDEAATVIQNVNRTRRREEAAHQLMMLEQDDLHLHSHATARVRLAAKSRRIGVDPMGRPVHRGGYVALGFRMRRMRRAPPVTKRTGRVLMGKQGGGQAASSSQPSMSSESPDTTGDNVAQVVVADSYLMPVLKRFGSSSLVSSGQTSAAFATTVNATASSAASTLVTNSDHSVWYAERQRCRDIARQKARLWNSRRVMKTLLEWTVKSAESSSDIPEPPHTNSKDAQVTAANTDASSIAMGGIHTRAGKTTSPPNLPMPKILELENSMADSSAPLSRTTSPGTDDTRTPPGADALTALLHVSTTTAIDAAVPSGLPSRNTLEEEMLAAKSRMRQTVRLRAHYQREQRAVSVSVAPTESVSSPEVNDNSSTVVYEELSGRDSDSLSEEHLDSNKVSHPSAVQKSSGEKPRRSHQNVAAVPLTSSLGKSGCTPRRALKPHEGNGPRRMATVPLPTATTRLELFGSHTRRRK